MRTPAEIKAEIEALKLLRPKGPFAEKTKRSIALIIEELEHGYDDTAGEWDELDGSHQMAILDARNWKDGNINNRPSKGWGELVERTKNENPPRNRK